MKHYDQDHQQKMLETVANSSKRTQAGEIYFSNSTPSLENLTHNFNESNHSSSLSSSFDSTYLQASSPLMNIGAPINTSQLLQKTSQTSNINIKGPSPNLPHHPNILGHHQSPSPSNSDVFSLIDQESTQDRTSDSLKRSEDHPYPLKLALNPLSKDNGKNINLIESLRTKLGNVSLSPDIQHSLSTMPGAPIRRNLSSIRTKHTNLESPLPSPKERFISANKFAKGLNVNLSPYNPHEISNQIAYLKTINCLNEEASDSPWPEWTNLLFSNEEYETIQSMLNLEPISSSTFDDYLQSVNELLFQFEKASSQYFNHPGKLNHDLPSKKELSPIDTSSTSNLSLEHCFKEVPNYFFSFDFSPSKHHLLEEPISSMLSRQDQLANYLDLVETALFDQLSHRYHSFLATLIKFDSYQDELNQLLESIGKIKANLHNFESHSLQNSLKILVLSRRKDTILGVIRKLEIINSLVHTKGSLKLLISSSDYRTALDLLSVSKDLYERELQNTVSLKYIINDILGIEEVIFMQLEKNFRKLTFKWILGNFEFFKTFESPNISIESLPYQKIDENARNLLNSKIKNCSKIPAFEADIITALDNEDYTQFFDSVQLLIRTSLFAKAIAKIKSATSRTCKKKIKKFFKTTLQNNQYISESESDSDNRATSFIDFNEEQLFDPLTTIENPQESSSLVANSTSKIPHCKFVSLWVPLLSYYLISIKNAKSWTCYTAQCIASLFYRSDLYPHDIINKQESSEKSFENYSDDHNIFQHRTQNYSYKDHSEIDKNDIENSVHSKCLDELLASAPEVIQKLSNQFETKMSYILDSREETHSLLSYYELGEIYWKTAKAVYHIYNFQTSFNKTILTIESLKKNLNLLDLSKTSLLEIIDSQEREDIPPNGDQRFNITSNLIYHLKTIFLQQSKVILDKFQQSKITETDSALDTERWERASVPLDFHKQILPHLIAHTEIFSIPDYLFPSKSSEFTERVIPDKTHLPWYPLATLQKDLVHCNSAENRGPFSSEDTDLQKIIEIPTILSSNSPPQYPSSSTIEDTGNISDFTSNLTKQDNQLPIPSINPHYEEMKLKTDSQINQFSSLDTNTDLSRNIPLKTQPQESVVAPNILEIGSRKFALVNTGYVVLKCLSEYELFSRSLPIIGLNLLQGVVQYLRSIFRQAIQLIVGGEVIHKNVIKRVSSSHLILCAQLIDCIIFILPHFEEILRSNLTVGFKMADQIEFQEQFPKSSYLHLSNAQKDLHIPSRAHEGISSTTLNEMPLNYFKSSISNQFASTIPLSAFILTSEFSDLIKEATEHRNKVLKKIQELLLERLEFHTIKWLSTKHKQDFYSELAPDNAHTHQYNLSSTSPHTAIRNMIKELLALHKVLTRFSRDEYLEQVFSKAFNLYYEKLNAFFFNFKI